MYSEKLYEEALEFFSKEAGVNIENEHVKKYAEELIYCFLHKGTSLIDFDFWTQYEELLGEKISYQEYLHIDGLYDGDPLDVEIDDNEQIQEFRKNLEEYKEEQKEVASITLHKMLKSYEYGDGIRSFDEVALSMDENVVKEAFQKERAENFHFANNGIYSEGDGYVESNYVDGVGLTIIELEESEIKFTKAQLREFLKGIDKEVLKEVLPEELRKDPLMAFIEKEVPWRMKEIHGISLTDNVKEELVSYVQNDTDIMFDYDKFDMHLTDKHEELMKARLNVYEAAINHLCDSLNKYREDGDYERKADDFQLIFESECYYGIYFYNGDNEYYLVDKDSGRYDLVLGDSPDFVGRYYLDAMKNQKEIHIENADLFGWLVEYSRENITGFDYWTDEKTKGLQIMENAFIGNLLNNALDLLKESYIGWDFAAWAEKEIYVSQPNKENALYNALVLLEEGYTGSEKFSDWAEKEVGVSFNLMKKIGFLTDDIKEKDKVSSLDEKLVGAKARKSVQGKPVIGANGKPITDNISLQDFSR